MRYGKLIRKNGGDHTMIDGNKLAKDLEVIASFGEGMPVVLVLSLHQFKDGKSGKLKTVIGFEEWKKVYPPQAEGMPEYGPEDIKKVEKE